MKGLGSRGFRFSDWGLGFTGSGRGLALNLWLIPWAWDEGTGMRIVGGSGA